MAEQLLSDFRAPYINSNVASRVLANEVLFYIQQGIIETDGQGVTQRFSTDTSGAEIRIIVPQPLNMYPRELGADINGEDFPSDVKSVGSTSIGLKVLQVIDSPIDIAQVTQDMIPISLLETNMKSLGMEINKEINAMTIAFKVANTMPAVQRGEVDLWTIDTANDTGAEIRNTIITANSALDSGDVVHSLAYFPREDRIMIIRPDMRPILMKDGAIIVGGSNYAQDIIRTGGVSTDGSVNLARSAIIGTLDGVPVAEASPVIWNSACGYLGLPVYGLDEVLGYISSGYANVRAIAQNEQVKIIDTPQGQGIRLQPLVRFGGRSFYPAGNQFFVTPDFDVDEFITACGGVIPSTDPNYGGDLLVRGKGSRVAQSNDTTLTSVQLGGQNGVSAGNNVYNITNVTANASTNLVVTPTVANAKIEIVKGNKLGANVVKSIGTLTATIDTTGQPAIIRVRVTAPNGTMTTYTLNVTYS